MGAQSFDCVTKGIEKTLCLEGGVLFMKDRMWCRIFNFAFILLVVFVLSAQNSIMASVNASAPIEIVCLEVRQEPLLQLKVPQLQTGMHPDRLAYFNDQFRQNVFAGLAEFERMVFETRLHPDLPFEVKAAMTYRADYEVNYNLNNRLSITQRTYQYTGGAHGMTWLKAKTIDLTTGKQLLLADLFKSGANYVERFNQKIKQEAKKRQWPLWGFQGIDAKAEYFLSDVGVVVFFQLYAIAPYSEGIIRITIPFSDLADILNPEYL